MSGLLWENPTNGQCVLCYVLLDEFLCLIQTWGSDSAFTGLFKVKKCNTHYTYLSWQGLNAKKVVIFDAKCFIHEQWLLLYSWVIHLSLTEKCLAFLKSFQSHKWYITVIQSHSLSQRIFYCLLITIKWSCVGPELGKRPGEWCVCLSCLCMGVYMCVVLILSYPSLSSFMQWSCILWPRHWPSGLAQTDHPH